MPSYATAVQGLYALGAELASAVSDSKPRRKFDLEHMKQLTEAMGHPEHRFPSILIAGTNGKGSTSATLASILTVSGYKTGLYTSPHLIKVNERIRVNGVAVEDAEFAQLYGHVQSVADDLVAHGKLEQRPSFFEVMTAMAFEHFAASGIEIAVLEVGLGGRLDATNVVDPLISVITDIDLDHQQWLGDTITEIAREKAGILRKEGTAVLLPQHPEANRAIGEIAMSLNVRAVNAAGMLPNTAPESEISSAYEVPWGEEMVEISSPLIGRHQWRNVALALATARELKTSFGFENITAPTIALGVRNTRWAGRFQQVLRNNRSYVFDVAHNPAGAWALRAALTQYGAGRPVTLIFGAMVDKRIDEIASVLFPVAEEVVLTKAQSSRAADPAQIAAQSSHTGAEFLLSKNVPEALELAKRHSQGGGIIVVTGSVFVVGEALTILDRESVV
jgi:dihydrofolate synthase/folylpolyglutamate synthase